MDENNQNREVTPDQGIFVSKGMKFSIQSFPISIGKDGKISSEEIILHTGIDMCPYWLNIAYGHLLKTETAHNNLMLAKDEKNNEKIGNSLQNEFISGMQSIVASCIAIDAYYASVKDHIDIPDSLVKIWHDNGTARYKQIAEVFRQAFFLKTNTAKKIRDILKESFDFRDKAVHPNYGTAQPQLHVELNKVTDWRYAHFRFYNSKAILGILLSIIFQTASKPLNNKRDGLKKYCAGLIIELNPLLTKWGKRYGKIF